MKNLAIKSQLLPTTLIVKQLALLLLFFISSYHIYAQVPHSENSKKTNQQLSAIQTAIAKQKQTLNSTTIERADLEKQLKSDDIAIGKISAALAKTASQLDENKLKLRSLKSEQNTLKQEKKKQEIVLAKQLRAAYSTGHHDYLKLILNQQDPASVQRTITQYQYLNKARIKEIESFKATIATLRDITAQMESKAQQLRTLTQQQHEQKQVLELSKIKQKQTLTALNKKLLSGQQKLAQLEKQETDLVTLLKNIAQKAKKAEQLNGLSKLKKKLNWPVRGRILNSFGSRKQGYLKWKGVLLSSPIGKQVTTIHSGTILFSDWLKGYGLVTVVDHGDGYMSLYGHNQALLKSVGERVEAGEPIALSGQSGGQSRPGLYFEIRHAGIAVNPKLWCK